MREGERPAVEFLDALEPGPDAVAPEPIGRPRTPARAPLVLAGAGLAVAALVAVGLQSRSAEEPTTATATRTAVASGTRTPVPPEQPVVAIAAVPRLALLPTPRCAAPCVVVDWVADSTAQAVAANFPGGTVQRQMTAFGPRIAAGRHPLLAREVTVRAGRVTVVVDVVPATGSRWVAPTVDTRGDEVHGSATRAGYLIAARVVHGGQHAAARVRRMLVDPGLMSVR